MTSTPLVSILVNNYNYARFLGQAIDSALAQTYKNIELIVVDDGSTDGSLDVIAKYGDKLIPILKENGGQASAYNVGFAASKGDIICLLDSDDLFLPEKVSRVVEIFQENLDIGWCFDRVHEFNDETGVKKSPAMDSSYGRWDVRQAMALGNSPNVPTTSSGLSFRREVLDLILPMPLSIRMSTGSSHDAYMKWIAMAHKEGWFASEELTHQRIHGSNAYTKQVTAKTRLNGQWELSTGICLHEQHPILRRLALKVFSRGLGNLWASGGVTPEFKQSISTYLKSLPLQARAEALTRAVCWSALNRLGHQ